MDSNNGGQPLLLQPEQPKSKSMSYDSTTVIEDDPYDVEERQSVGGCPCPPPPCLYSPIFRAICETSFCCRNCIGPIGLKSFERNRAKVMLFAALVSLFALALQFIPVIGISKNASTIENIPWAFGTFDDPDDGSQIKVFMGLRALLFQRVVDGEVEAEDVVSWDKLNCGEEIPGEDNADYCDTCSTIATDTTVVAILALITAIPQLSTDLTRSTRKFDVNCQKAFGILTGTFGGLTTLGALITFNEGCFTDVDNSIVFVPASISGTPRGIVFDWQLSFSFYCLLFATLLKPVDVICHFLTPTPKFVQDGKRDFVR